MVAAMRKLTLQPHINIWRRRLNLFSIIVYASVVGYFLLLLDVNIATPYQGLGGRDVTAPSTIVTAYFHIPSKHSAEEYEAWMTNILSLRDAMVIYTTEDMVNKIERLRANATDLTRIVPTKLENTRMARSYDSEFWKTQHALDPERTIHTDVRLYWIWNEKVDFLHRTVAWNPFQSEFFAWFDIGYFRTTDYNGKMIIQRDVSTMLQRNQVLMLDVTSLVNLEQHPNDRVGAGFLGGYAEGISRFHTGYYATLKINEGSFIGKEQGNMWKTCEAQSGVCHLVRPDRAHGDPWFYMAPFLAGIAAESHVITALPNATAAEAAPIKHPPKHHIAEPPDEAKFWAENEDRKFMMQLYPKLGQFSTVLDVGARGYTARCKALIASETTKYYQLEPHPPNSGMNNDGLLQTTMQDSLAKYPEYLESFDVVVDYGVLGWGAIDFTHQDIEDYISNVRALLKKGGMWALKIDKDAHSRMDYMLPTFIEPYFEGRDFEGFKHGMAIGTQGKNAYFFFKKGDPKEEDLAPKVEDAPIDIVIPWAGERPGDVSGVNRDDGTILYTIRSMLKNMPWARTIYIFADPTEPPKWLTEFGDKVQLINRCAHFIGGAANCPTENTYAVYANFHTIPELAEHFIACDDDVIISSPLTREHFFVGGKVVAAVRGQEGAAIYSGISVDKGVPYVTEITTPYHEGGKRVLPAKLPKQIFGAMHTAWGFFKSEIKAMQAEYTEWFEFVSSHRVRFCFHSSDKHQEGNVNGACWHENTILAFWWYLSSKGLLQSGRTVPEFSVKYEDITEHRLSNVLASGKHATVNINDSVMWRSNDLVSLANNPEAQAKYAARKKYLLETLDKAFPFGGST